MRTYRTLALGAAVLALLVSACQPGGGEASPGGDGSPAGETPTITVGSAGFYESQLMAEIYAQALEDQGYTVQRNLGIGTREQTYPALTSGEIDLMPEYTGSLLTFTGGTASGDPEETYQLLLEAIESDGLTALDFTPAQDQNAFVVRPETAEQYGLETMSDLAGVATELVWGLPPECETNPLCAGALEEQYGIPYDELEIESFAACDAPIATALNDGVVDVAELCSTQPDIERFGFVVLEDDLLTQPAENIVPVIRTEVLDRLAPEFRETLDAVSAEMSTEELTSLGVLVAVEQEDIADVAAQWLGDNGF